MPCHEVEVGGGGGGEKKKKKGGEPKMERRGFDASANYDT